MTSTAVRKKRATAKPFVVEAGSPHPLGATPDAGGVNFSLFSQNATSVELLVFGDEDSPSPTLVVHLDPPVNKTFSFWHVYVRGLPPGCHYAYRVDGPRDASHGHRFDPEKVVLDPYVKGVCKALWNRADACVPGDNLGSSLRGAVIDINDYDWDGDQPLKRSQSETIIYEMHVGGFTASPSSGVEHPGTFAGVIDKIPYLRALGVTAVELLPVFDFDEHEVDRTAPDGRHLANYWGYSTNSFFAPHSGYCVTDGACSHIREFRDMVKALHRAGIEVILDVVFNHTGEGNEKGPTINFKGIDNSTYYIVSPEDNRYYMDYTGTGNTVNCNHPVVEKMIVECLDYWVEELHVDGFRFDEGSVLSRGPDGAPMRFPPVLWHIELSERLADVKIFAEAWDAAGLYQIGYFPGYRWAEWNGRFRDDIRRFVRGEQGLVSDVAARIAGSADIYQATGHLPVNSVNFITCHDGFTLNDLASYDRKHNEANGEGDRDGMDNNMSWNCGVEGDTDDPDVQLLRRRQMKNFASILLLSQGVPMITAGDEVCRTQHGNNNGYCQANDLSWFDWKLPVENAAMLRFWQRMIAFRRSHPLLHHLGFLTGQADGTSRAEVEWHGCMVGEPGFHDPSCRVLALTLNDPKGAEPSIHVILNMESEELSFELPEPSAGGWLLVADTGVESPHDIAEPGREKLVPAGGYRALGRSVVVLVSSQRRGT
jgi:isoamylase